MGFRIITDSASDLPQETAARWGVTVMPLHIRFGEEEYLDGVTLKPQEFFRKLEKKKEVPRTSQITPFEYGQEFKKAAAAGEGVLCITMSSGVSGTYQSACAAAGDCGGRVIVIDSRQFCISLYILVEFACRCRDRGMGLEETVAAIEEEKKRVHVISMFATLEYLRLGGRLSAAAAFAGNLLSIKPIITISNGLVEVVGRARGGKKGNSMIIDFIRNTGGIDREMPMCLGFTGYSDEGLKKYIDDNASSYRDFLLDLPVVAVGSTVGTYTGPGAVALAYFNKK